jgi:hypothetical protein
MDLKAAKTPHGNTRWLLSFIDLFSVFLAFFVLMFAMQSIDKGKWQQFSGAMRGSFPTAQTQQVILPDGQPDLTYRPKPLLDGLSYLSSVITQQTGDTWRGQVAQGTLSYPLTTATTQNQFLILMRAISRLSNPTILSAPANQLSTAWQWLKLAEEQTGATLQGVQLSTDSPNIQLLVLPNKL